ncbi:hypothetical protein KM043_006488 [Ampulex compressa]|nr:hypothetical protein KM043_006488 [Ampulex compressa]
MEKISNRQAMTQLTTKLFSTNCEAPRDCASLFYDSRIPDTREPADRETRYAEHVLRTVRCEIFCRCTTRNLDVQNEVCQWRRKLEREFLDGIHIGKGLLALDGLGFWYRASWLRD